MSPIMWFIPYELQCVDHDVVPSPSLLEVALRSILKKNLVALLNIDRLVRHFLAQHRDAFAFDGLFQQFREIFHGSLKIAVTASFERTTSV